MRRTLCQVALVVWIGAACQDVPEQRINEDDAALADHGLEFTASPLQTGVPMEGPLLVEITILNVADSVVQFRPIFTFGRWLDAEILDSTGTPLPKTAAIDPPNAWAVSLEPGDSIVDTVDLRCSIPASEGVPCMAPYDLSHPGAYNVKMRFTLPCDIEGCDEFVTVEAEPFKVRVDGEENET